MTTIWRPDLTQFDGPKYLALSHALRDAVRRGELPEGTRLPPVRELAWALSITPGTVARAYQIVTQDGLLEATVGRGTYVAARAPRLGPTHPILKNWMRSVLLRFRCQLWTCGRRGCPKSGRGLRSLPY